MRGEPATSPVGALVEALAGGTVEVVDLTQPLNERTPVLRLPEQCVNTPGLKRHEISRYDERGPAWAWYWLEIGEHVGTHFDAPVHWITGREGRDVSQAPPRHLVAPAVVIDKSVEAGRDPDYLITFSARGSTASRSLPTSPRCRRPARCSWRRR